MSTSIEMVALELLDVVPPIMSTIKMKWKKGTILGVTNTQFKILAYLEKNPAASLPAIALDRGLPLPTVAAAIDDMAAHGLVLQAAAAGSPSETTCSLSAEGRKILLGIYEKSRTDLEEHLSPLSAEERTQVFQALKIMGPLFAPNKEPDENIEVQKELWKSHE